MSHRQSAAAVAPKRERVFYLDLVRALATALIVLTHFNNPYFSGGGYLLTNTPFGIYVGGLGVSLFLIISGAALTLTYGGKGKLNIKRFYLKRFQNIYPMFWTAWVLATGFFFVVRHGFPPNAAPTRSLIWTLLGFDGYMANFHIRTAYLLGEWFLGFILLFYLIFPLLLWGVERHPVPTVAIVVALYAASLWFFHSHPDYPSAIILPTRLPELVFGMMFVKYVKRVHWAVVIPAIAVMLVSAQFPTQIPEDLATTAVGIAAFLVLVVAGRWVAIGPVRSLVSFIAKYSYPIFLVHHVVIYQVFSTIDASTFYPVQKYMMLAFICVIVVLLAVALPKLTGNMVSGFRSAFAGQWWRPEVSEFERGAKSPKGESSTWSSSSSRRE